MLIKRTVGPGRWTSTLATFVAFGALCATLAYWTMQLMAPPVAIAPTGTLVDYRSVPELDSAAALFGMPGTATAQTAQVDVRVLGVAASPQRASAVLIVGSGTARAFMVGDRVGDDMRLVEVRADAAVIERNGARIELLAPKRPSVAMLSSSPAASGSSVDLRAPASLAPGGDPPAPLPAHGAAAAAPAGLSAPGSPDPAIDAATLSPRPSPLVREDEHLSGLRDGGAAAASADGTMMAPGAAREPRPDPAAAAQIEEQPNAAPAPGGIDPR